MGANEARAIVTGDGRDPEGYLKWGTPEKGFSQLTSSAEEYPGSWVDVVPLGFRVLVVGR